MGGSSFPFGPGKGVSVEKPSGGVFLSRLAWQTSRFMSLVVIDLVLTGLIVAGPTDGATDCKNLGTTRIQRVSKNLKVTSRRVWGFASLSSSNGRPSSKKEGYVITTPLAVRINDLERQILDEKLVLVDDDGKPLKRELDNDTARYMSFTNKAGRGANYVGPLEDEDFDCNDRHEDQFYDLPEAQQAFCDQFDIRLPRILRSTSEEAKLNQTFTEIEAHLLRPTSPPRRRRILSDGVGRNWNGFTRRTARSGPKTLSLTFIKENVDVLRTMIKEHDQPKPTPFTTRITRLKYHRRAKIPRKNIKVYKGCKDSEDHLGIFSAVAELEEWTMPIWCKMFCQTLSGAARNWFDNLDPKSVDNFKELSQKFLEEFSQQKRYAKDPTKIHGIKKRLNEGLQEFMERFKLESSHIKGVPPVLRISAFMHSHGHPELARKLKNKIPKTVDELFKRNQKNRGQGHGNVKVINMLGLGGSHNRPYEVDDPGLTNKISFLAIPQNSLADALIILEGMIEGFREKFTTPRIDRPQGSEKNLWSLKVLGKETQSSKRMEEGKFIDYMATTEGIKADLEKVRAILWCNAPERPEQGFTTGLAVLITRVSQSRQHGMSKPAR
uniref:Reverse transcriptase domain-containing protein n=1 Tax=Tanacetum cinerariifolium TaxID=118510 RepID=A0A6L2NR58_TANCI|nr:reverse transcriptase domain-containing protein [Tanacetum cinerariifolium]